MVRPEMKTKDLTLMGILTALALALSLVERMIPLELLIPLPGVKLGLANTVTLFALYRLSPAQAALILTARCLLTAAFSGNMTGLAFSMAGGLISLGVMAAARHSRHLSVFGVSVLGAAGHNFGQILTARLLMNSPYIWGYLPYLLLIGTACGLATGAVGAGVLRALGAAGKSLRGA
ncbi:MAG: Gx transporter family protein [Clostridia bacterium]|nr:Gx transporter family protein [Clostridia bacterium]